MIVDQKHILHCLVHIHHSKLNIYHVFYHNYYIVMKLVYIYDQFDLDRIFMHITSTYVFYCRFCCSLQTVTVLLYFIIYCYSMNETHMISNVLASTPRSSSGSYLFAHCMSCTEQTPPCSCQWGLGSSLGNMSRILMSYEGQLFCRAVPSTMYY